MEKPNEIPLPDEFFIVAVDDGKSIVAGNLESAVYFLHWDDAVDAAVNLGHDKPVVIFQCGRQLRITA